MRNNDKNTNNYDSKAYKAQVSRADNIALRTLAEHLDDPRGNGLMLRGAAVTALDNIQITKKKEEETKSHAMRISKAIAQQINDHLAKLDAKIETLNKQIRAIEESVFTKEELEEFDKLSPDERFKKMQEEMKKKLERGEINQDDYDLWLLSTLDRNAFQNEKDIVSDKLANAQTDEGLTKIVEEHDIDAVRNERHSLNESDKALVEGKIEDIKDDGNKDFSSVLGALGTDTFTKITPSQYAKEGNPLKDKAPAVRCDFNSASCQADLKAEHDLAAHLKADPTAQV
tara:strand:+ start:1582 stop:2439 length:858 start_codon:yes stop_codon:yes gene_type:complete